MTIKRVESLLYGAEDISAGVKFHEELGLEKVESGASLTSLKLLRSTCA